MPEPQFFDQKTYAPTHGPVITDAVNAVAAPTQAEFNALVAKFNTALAALRSAGIISQN